jgi:segregation and condensation protein B
MFRGDRTARDGAMIDRNDELLPFGPTDWPEESEPPAEQPGEEAESTTAEWNGDDIEQAYQKALAAMDEVPWEPAAVDSAEAAVEPDAQETVAATDPFPFENEVAEVPAEYETTAGLQPETTTETAAIKPQGTGPRLASGTERRAKETLEEHTQVTPAQIIEAALFVGGGALTAKKICALLRGSFDVAFVHKAIDELNAQYLSEARPYEIVSGDGGYRLELRSEYEKLRQRVYGSGPREVKLSQDILEVLALVAYQQPISQPEVESHGKQNAGNLLRQLLRRDLVSIQRGEGGRKDVRYLTTPRFLQVFGLGNLDELPQPDDLARK